MNSDLAAGMRYGRWSVVTMRYEMAERSSNTGNYEPPNISILAVVPEARATELEHILSHTRWRLQLAHSVAGACAVLRSEPISVVLCESELPDGSWTEVIEETNRLSPPPPIIVLVPTLDQRLWSSIKNLGGYDVLCRPILCSEFYSLVPAAWRHWTKQHDNATQEDTALMAFR